MQNVQQSQLAKTLEYILSMQDKIHVISNMAFEAIDVSGDGQLDKEELGQVLRDISITMGINQPTDTDLAYILHELD